MTFANYQIRLTNLDTHETIILERFSPSRDEAVNDVKRTFCYPLWSIAPILDAPTLNINFSAKRIPTF